MKTTSQSKNKYDLIAVLGYRFEEGWRLPQHVTPRLQTVANLFLKGAATHIAVCGKWSLYWDNHKIIPPTTEAEEMKKILTRYGIPFNSVIKEEWSKDTIGNAYFLKKRIVEKMKHKTILVVCADFHKQRAEFIFKKVFGCRYNLDFLATETNICKDDRCKSSVERLFNKQKEYLSNMKDGQDEFLKGKLYEDNFFRVIIQKAIGLRASGLGFTKWFNKKDNA